QAMRLHVTYHKDTSPAISWLYCHFFVLHPLLTGVFYAILFKYSVEVLRRSSEGDMRPPPLSYSVLVEEYDLPLKMFAMVVFFAALVYSVISSVGLTVGLILIYFGLFVYPASLMVLASTGSLLSAIHPLLLIDMIIRIRWLYLVLTGLMMLLGNAEMNLQQLVLSRGDAAWVELIFSVVIIYFQIITYHMMGYILYQGSEALGVKRPASVASPAEEYLLTRYDQFLDQGNTAAAISELKTLIKDLPTNLELHRRMHNLMLMEQMESAAGKHASRQYIPKLLAADKGHVAACTYLECTERNIELQFKSPGMVVQLAKELRGMDKGRQVMPLLNGFHKTYPKSDEIVDAYLLGAHICCEDLSRDDLAKQLLEFIVRRYPSHPRSAEARDYLEMVRNL
ncbi:MAG: hypothetical protein ABW168_07005, partial [Sedimenticola sp.]